MIVHQGTASGRCGLLVWSALLICAGCALPREHARMNLDRGNAALAAHDIDAALAEFREAVRLDPNHAEAHTKLGLAYKQKGDLGHAAESLKNAVRLDPNDFVSIFELGEVYRLLNRVTQAIRAYAIACELNPLDFGAHARLADCYYRSGDMDAAAKTYEEALKLDSRNARPGATSAPYTTCRAGRTKPSRLTNAHWNVTRLSRPCWSIWQRCI